MCIGHNPPTNMKINTHTHTHARTHAHTHSHHTPHTHSHHTPHTIHSCYSHTYTGCCISSLHFSNLTLYVGLTSGKVLIMDACLFTCLCELSCHRNQVKSLFTIDLSLLQQQQDRDTLSLYEREKIERLSSSGSVTNPSPVHHTDSICRSPSLSSVQTINSNSHQLLSFGAGFKSYFDGPESKQYWDSGFLLVWDSEHWDGEP